MTFWAVSCVSGWLRTRRPRPKLSLARGRDDSGATAIACGFITAGISVAIVTVVSTLGTNLNVIFTTVANALK
jgi:pilus assembly protein Flp/PilA